MPRYSLTPIGLNMTDDIEEKSNDQRLAEMEANADAEKAARKPGKKRGPNPKPKNYTNVSTINLFTESGRMAPGQSCILTAKEVEVFGDKVEKCP